MEKKLAGFEAGMRELEKTLERMSDEDITLDESIELYARAAQLIKQSNEQLNTARVRIEEIDASLQDIMPDGETI